MSDQKFYAERDAHQLNVDGEYYTRHVMAMTREGLHSKSDIAAELAHRDKQVDALAAQVAMLRRLGAAVCLEFPERISTAQKDFATAVSPLGVVGTAEACLNAFRAQSAAQALRSARNALANGQWPDELTGQRHHAGQRGWWLCVECLDEHTAKYLNQLNTPGVSNE